jgi:hypothetical protein
LLFLKRNLKSRRKKEKKVETILKMSKINLRKMGRKKRRRRRKIKRKKLLNNLNRL